MMKVTKFYVRSFDLDALTIFWEIEDLTKEDDIYAYDMRLFKCESPTGPFDFVYGPFQNIFTFRDSVHPENHKLRTIYYKLSITDKRTNESVEFISAQQPELDLEALEIVRLEDTLLRTKTGRKCYLFPRKTFGQKCICVNTRSQRVEVGNCKTCYGVGYLGGYNTPIKFYCQIDNYSKTMQPTPTINHNVIVTKARTINYPPINPGDIIVESENTRWVVIDANCTQRLRADVHCEMTIKELLKSDISYLLPILDDIKKVDEISDRRNFTNPQNIHTSFKPDYRGFYPDGLVF